MTAQRRVRRATDHELRGVYLTLREQFRQRCIAERRECWFGDGPIDWSLRHPDPGSFELHHIEPVALRPDLELVPSNFAASHKICNRLNMAAYDPDGVGDVPDTGIASEEW